MNGSGLNRAPLSFKMLLTYFTQISGGVFMNVRCNYCGQNFNLSSEFMAKAVAEATEKRQKSYAIECFNCRKQIKVSVARMRPFAQAAAEMEEPQAEPEARADDNQE
jgi:hypothetical protein